MEICYLTMKTDPDTAKPLPEAEKAGTKVRYVAKPQGSWRKLVGSMKDCDLFDDAMRSGEEWRNRMNREGR